MSKLLRSRRRGRVRDDADDLLSEPEDAVSLTSHESASDSESNPTDTEDSYTDGDRCDSETEDSTSSDDDNSSIVSSQTEGHDNQDEQEQEHAESQVELQVQERDANASPDQQEEERSQKENVDKKWRNLTERERLILERREYRRKLAEDPSFVPNVGQFWSHDDRFRETAKLEPGSAAAAAGQLDGLAAAAAATDMDMSRKFRMDGRHSNKKPGHRRVPEEVINSRWTHDGYEELCRLEEQEVKERRKYKERGERWPPRRRRGGYRGGRDSPTRRLRTRLSPSEYDGDGANNSWQLAGASNLVTEINSWPALSPKKDDSIPSQVNNKVETSTTEGADTQQEQSTKVLDSGWSTVQEPISNDGNNDWASVPVATNVDTWNIPEQKSPSQELQPVSDKSLQTEEQKADGVVDSKESSVNKQQSEKADASRKVDTWSTEQEDSTDSWKAEATKGWGSIEAPAMQNIDSWTKTEETAPASDGWKQTVTTGWGKTETPGAKDTDSWTNVQDTAAAAADATDDFKKEPTNTWGSIETPAVNGFDSCTNQKDMSAEADNWKTEAAKGWNTIETPLEKGVNSWTSVQDTGVAATDNRSKEASNTQRSIETTTVNGTDSWTKTANGKSAPSATDNSDKTHANAWSAIETPVISSNDPWTDTKDSSLEGDSWKTEAAKGWSTIETPVEKIANSWTQPKDGEGTDAATDSWKADAASSWKDFGMPEVDTWQVDNRDTKKEEAEGQNDSWTQVESDISKIGPQKEKKQQLKQTETPLEDEEWVSSPAEEQSSSRRNKSDFDVNGKPIPRIPRPFKERRRPHVKNIENEKASSAWSSWVASKQKQPNGEPPRKSGRGYLSQKKQPEETSASAVDRKQQKEREEQPQTRMPNRYQAAATADIPSSPGLLFNNKKERPVPKGKVDVFDFEAMDEPWKPSSPHKRQDAAGHERFIEEGDPSDQDSDVEILVDEGDTPPAGWSHRGEEEEPQDIPTPPSTTLDRDSSDSRQHSESPGAPPYMHYPPQAAFYYPPDLSAYYGMPAAYAVPMVYAAPPPLPPAPSSQDGSTDSQTAPTAYQANGMVYYGVDPSAMYQYYYYYYPPMMPPGAGDGEDEFNNEGWGPEPENRHNGGWNIKHHQANINGGYYYYPHPTIYSYK